LEELSRELHHAGRHPVHKTIGFNSVRVPFNYRLFVSDADPTRLEGEGYGIWTDVVAWCRKRKSLCNSRHARRAGGQTETTSMIAGAIRFYLKAPRARI